MIDRDKPAGTATAQQRHRLLVRERGKRYMWIWSAIWMSLSLLICLSIALPGDKAPYPLALGVLFLIQLGTLIMVSSWSHSRLKRAKKAGYLMCPYCTYDLRGTDSLETKVVLDCPECGMSSKRGELPGLWDKELVEKKIQQ